MGEPGARQQLRALLDEQVARWQRDYRRGLRPLDIADPEAAVERALAEPDRLRPPRAAARRPGRLGNHGQRTRLHFHQTTFRRRGIPPRGVPRRRTRGPGAHQDPRRCQPVAPEAGSRRGAAGRPARQRRPAAHRAFRCGSGRPRPGQHPQVLRRPAPVAGRARSNGACSMRSRPGFCTPACAADCPSSSPARRGRARPRC